MSDATRRVRVVSVGAITSLGDTAEQLWAGARDATVAITPVRHLDWPLAPGPIAGEVDRIPAAPGRRSRVFDHADRALALALPSVAEAMAGLPAGLVAAERLGVVLGTCNAGLLSARAWLDARRRGACPHPEVARTITPQALAEAVAVTVDARGPVLAVNTACASGANAIGLAADLIRLGRADAVLAGGVDALSDVVIAGFSALQSLAAEPAAPYSRARAGLSLGEGSGWLLLLRADLADGAGLRALADVAGYGLSADAYHPTAPRPDGSGAAEAMRGAMADAGLTAVDIGYVNGHGTGTAKNDVAETRAIRAALGPASDTVAVSSTKAVIGHLLGAAGAVEAVVTTLALRDRTMPPTAGAYVPDPDCDLDYLPGRARAWDGRAAVSNSMGFGGANAAVVLTRPGLAAPPAHRREPVVVTGLAVFSPAGEGMAPLLRLAGGGAPDASPSTVAFDADPFVDRRARRRMDRLSALSVVSAATALITAGIGPGTADAERTGLIVGTGVGPAESIERFLGPVLAEGPRAADPSVFPNTVYSQAAGQVATHVGLRGPASTVSVGHASGAVALGYAADLIGAGRADRVVVVATDVLTDAVLDAYRRQGVLRGHRRVAGLALIEASVAIVLERREVAARRAATVFGEVRGWGAAHDARSSGLWDPAGRGMERAMLAALRDASTTPDAVGDVWLAAAGLPSADEAERAAVARALPAAQKCHAPKVAIGEPIGVGGALLSLLALDDLSRHESGSRVSVVNSSSLGGSHVSLVVAGRGTE
ncbi:3-ketoacyl-ACP synthase [Solihabitans fulvus]|uniref:3-ketoacyl-ACP synthase n=1 Tax=Solihabitans fulvus TaxID=1892852 RepID=A0A5B2XIP4_9PSEU|nr:beta-ketoacyl-[acyl-carrier-protein] synthase family protein [Solihabitans fulvus]KAA2262622.1 3-ketoacyl-ACP synthase [Solihabitans fulvus]